MRILLAACFTALLSVSALYAQERMSHDQMKKMDESATTATSAAAKGYEAAMMKMHDKMAQPYTNDPDVDFANRMLPHHQGAIDMAKVVLEHGKDKKIRQMATKVIKDQKAEISELKDWLAQHSKSVD